MKKKLWLIPLSFFIITGIFMKRSEPLPALANTEPLIEIQVATEPIEITAPEPNPESFINEAVTEEALMERI